MQGSTVIMSIESLQTQYIVIHNMQVLEIVLVLVTFHTKLCLVLNFLIAEMKMPELEKEDT